MGRSKWTAAKFGRPQRKNLKNKCKSLAEMVLKLSGARSLYYTHLLWYLIPCWKIRPNYAAMIYELLCYQEITSIAFTFSVHEARKLIISCIISHQKGVLPCSLIAFPANPLPTLKVPWDINTSDHGHTPPARPHHSAPDR